MVIIDNLIKQMEETATQLGAGLPELAELIEEWARAVEALRSEVREAKDTKSEAENMEDMVQKAVGAAKCHQLYKE